MMGDAHYRIAAVNAKRAPFSPRGRRWPDEVGSDEGAVQDRARRLTRAGTQSRRPLIRPAIALRFAQGVFNATGARSAPFAATFPRKGGRGSRVPIIALDTRGCWPKGRRKTPVLTDGLWRQQGSDEGAVQDRAPSLTRAHMSSTTPHPSSLRDATFPRKGGRGSA